MTTLALLNMKGGVGKTILAVNLAAYLHQAYASNVLLVDLDPQFNATQYVLDFKTFEQQRKAGHTIASLLIDQPKLALKGKKQVDQKSKVHKAVLNLKSLKGKRLDLLPSELELAWAVKNPAQMEFRLEKLLEVLRPNYDYIVIDCAPTDSVLTTMALTASDFLLIPMRPDRFSILGFANLMECVNTFKKNSQDPHQVKILGIVFTQVTQQTPVQSQSMQEVADVAKKDKVHLFTNKLSWSNSFQRSVRDQTPIFLTQYAQAHVRSMIGKITAEVLGQMNSANIQPKKGKK